MPIADELGIEDVQHVVENIYGLETLQRGDELDILCPSHADSNPSCSVNINSGLWLCLACGAAGDIVQLGVIVLKEDARTILDAIRPGTPEAIAIKVSRQLAKIRLSSWRKRADVSAVPQHYGIGPFDELYARGFTADTLLRWGVRYVQETKLIGKDKEFTITNSIAIPIRNSPGGRVEAWCYRRTTNSAPWQPRYLYNKDAPLSRLWFGLQHHREATEIVVVEGALDAMWLDQAGIPALALLGAQMGSSKMDTLLRYKQVTILADRDEAGVHSAIKIGTAIHPKVPVRVARYPKKSQARDPADMHAIDIELAVATSIPWALWRRSLVKA